MNTALMLMHNEMFTTFNASKKYTFKEMDYYNERKEGTCDGWSELLSAAAADSFLYYAQGSSIQQRAYSPPPSTRQMISLSMIMVHTRRLVQTMEQ